MYIDKIDASLEMLNLFSYTIEDISIIRAKRVAYDSLYMISALSLSSDPNILYLNQPIINVKLSLKCTALNKIKFIGILNYNNYDIYKIENGKPVFVKKICNNYNYSKWLSWSEYLTGLLQ